MREYVRDHGRLEHIVEAIDRILAFADGKTKDELEADNLKYSSADIADITGLAEDEIESL